MKDRFDYTPTKFLVGGVRESSAIVAYEQGVTCLAFAVPAET
jgi:hypothetical protein